MIWSFIGKILLEIVTSVVVEVLVAAIHSAAKSYRGGRVMSFA